MARKATAKSFDEMDDKVLICRATKRHLLELTMTKIVTIGRRQGLEYHWGPCINCKTGRIDTVLANHRERKVERLSRYYDHPEHYLIEKIDEWGGRKMFNQSVEYELYVRMFEKAKKGGKNNR